MQSGEHMAHGSKVTAFCHAGYQCSLDGVAHAVIV